MSTTTFTEKPTYRETPLDTPQTETDRSPRDGKDDSKPAVAKIAAAARDAIDVAEQKGIEAEAMLRSSPEQVERTLKNAEAKTRSGLDQATTTATEYVNEKPLQSLAIAFGAGAILAALMRR